MAVPRKDDLLWWVIPGVLAGMPIPYIHPDRRMQGGAPLAAFDDDLCLLHSAGVRSVVSLLNIPTDQGVYGAAGFEFLCLPIRDGDAPDLEQSNEFVRFVENERRSNRPVAVHCQAGAGRTGTMLAVYLIACGKDSASAICQVRSIEKTAIETAQQIRFLADFEKASKTHLVAR